MKAFPSCPCCARAFRSEVAYQHYLNRKRVHAELAEYVSAMRAGRAVAQALAAPTKIERHRAQSAEHRGGMA